MKAQQGSFSLFSLVGQGGLVTWWCLGLRQILVVILLCVGWLIAATGRALFHLRV